MPWDTDGGEIAKCWHARWVHLSVSARPLAGGAGCTCRLGAEVAHEFIVLPMSINRHMLASCSSAVSIAGGRFSTGIGCSVKPCRVIARWNTGVPNWCRARLATTWAALDAIMQADWLGLKRVEALYRKAQIGCAIYFTDNQLVIGLMQD